VRRKTVPLSGAGSSERSVAKVLYVRITGHVWLAVERSRRSQASAARWQSSARYGGEMPGSDWCTSVATLKSTRWRTSSECSWRSTGDMWSERRVPVTRRAAAFWPTAAGSSVLQRCRRTVSCSSPGGRKRTQNIWTNFTRIFRQRPDSLPQLVQLVVAALTDCSDVSRQRQLAVDDDAKVAGCVLHFYAWWQNAPPKVWSLGPAR